jgi:hypothetical protein
LEINAFVGVNNMPGLSIIYGTDLIDDSLYSLRHHPKILIKKNVVGKKFFIVRSGFEGYPFFQYSNNDFTIFIEGIIYNLSSKEIKEGLSRIVHSYLEKLNYKDEINKFISSCCGEFIVLIHIAKTRNFLIFNDQWGRLPFFWFMQDDTLILSREIKFILNYLAEIHYNKIALLEYLVLRYPLGDRTIFRDIFRFLPGHLMICSANLFSYDEVVCLNFEMSYSRLYSRKYYAQKARNILLSSTKKRLSKLQTFSSKAVDITGGYDSRAVLATVSKLEKNIIPITIDSITGNESSVANQVAKACGFETLLIKPNRDFAYPTLQDVLYKIDAFSEGKRAAISYQNSEQVMRQLKEPIAEFMGFGGEFLRHPLKTRVYFKNMLDVIYGVVPSSTLIESTCQCLGLKEKEVRDFWQDFFHSAYKEVKIEDEVMHFYFDYYNLYVGEGEDHHRIHLWPVNPMLSSEWLHFATKEVPRKLIGYELFEEILCAINPLVAVSKIPIWDKKSWNQEILETITNHTAIQKLMMFPKVIRELKRKLQRRKRRKIAQTDSKRKAIINEIDRLYRDTPTIRRYFDRESILQYYQKEFGPNNSFLHLLHSLFLYMNKIESIFSEQT